MKAETKEFVYTLLDIVDALQKSIFFANVDNEKLASAKRDLVELLNFSSNLVNESSNSISKKNSDIISSLIGVVPFILVDKEKFPTNSHIIRFAEKSLNLHITSWEKKSREELIGRFIVNIASKKQSELVDFLMAWRAFMDDDIQLTDNKSKKNKTDFVDTWLNFFENYHKK